MLPRLNLGMCSLVFCLKVKNKLALKKINMHMEISYNTMVHGCYQSIIATSFKYTHKFWSDGLQGIQKGQLQYWLIKERAKWERERWLRKEMRINKEIKKVIEGVGTRV